MVGLGAKGYGRRVPAVQLLDDLVDHPQMRMTLEMCDVYAVGNHKQANRGKPLKLTEIPPLPGAEASAGHRHSRDAGRPRLWNRGLNDRQRRGADWHADATHLGYANVAWR